MRVRTGWMFLTILACASCGDGATRKRCEAAIAKVTSMDGKELAPPSKEEQAVIDQVRKVTLEKCVAEGLSPEQAACFDAIHDLRSLFEAPDCPALATKKPSWFLVPPDDVRRAALADMRDASPQDAGPAPEPGDNIGVLVRPLPRGAGGCSGEGGIPNATCCAETYELDLDQTFTLAATLGEDVSPFLFDMTPYETGGVIRVYRGDLAQIGKGTKFGLMDRDGKLVVPFEYDFIEWMCGGQARVCQGCARDCGGDPSCEHWSIAGGTWSCIDPAGKPVPCAKSTR